MKIHINWKKTIIATLDVLLAIYLVFAFTSFNEPANSAVVCRKCNIRIADENTNGFLKAEDVTKILTSSKMMPVNKKTGDISTRAIEEKLKSMAFVKTAQCFKAENGDVTINITQRLPLLRVKSQKGDDYYIDERGGVMPNSNYVSDLIIATGNIDKRYATDYLMPKPLRAKQSAPEKRYRISAATGRPHHIHRSVAGGENFFCTQAGNKQDARNQTFTT